MEQIRWIDFKQFIREDNLRIVKQYKISPILLVGFFGDVHDEKLLSNQTKKNLILVGSPNNLKEIIKENEMYADIKTVYEKKNYINIFYFFHYCLRIYL